MSLSPVKFVRKPTYVHAIQITAENIADITRWSGGDLRGTEEDSEHRFIKIKAFRPVNDRQSKGFVGDWMVLSGNNFKVYTSKAFDKLYTETPETSEKDWTLFI